MARAGRREEPVEDEMSLEVDEVDDEDGDGDAEDLEDALVDALDDEGDDEGDLPEGFTVVGPDEVDGAQCLPEPEDMRMRIRHPRDYGLPVEIEHLGLGPGEGLRPG
ncbi:MAG: hypothetical protein ACO3VG_04510, partial [Nitriliruptoraceae bacterium]